MLATSWKAKGLVRAAWLRLEAEKDKRGELARRTGIPATNLSAMNTGNMPMTPEAAQRIIQVVPGLTLEDLGAPTTPSTNGRPLVSARLEEVVAEVAEARREARDLAQLVADLTERVERLEALGSEGRGIG